MNKKVLFLWLFMLSSYAYAASEEEMIKESQLAIKQLSSELKHTLQKQMKNGGHVNAIAFCNSEAGELTRQLSTQAGWKIARTSLKARNANNKPDAWEKQVLQSFEQRKSKGEQIQQLDYSEIIETNNQSVFRYMKAIPTNEPCLSCHGDNLSTEVAEKLKQLYPNDKATGFKAGDIRGAFTITRIID